MDSQKERQFTFEDQDAGLDMETAIMKLSFQIQKEVGASILFEKFLKFHRLNPRIYDLIEKFSYEISRTHEHYGIGAIFERVRWEISISTTSAGDGLKLCNNHRAYYARLVSIKNPELSKFFRSKKLGGFK